MRDEDEDASAACPLERAGNHQQNQACALV